MNRAERIKKIAEEALPHYLECACWSSGDEEHDNYDIFEVSDEFKSLSLIDITYFIKRTDYQLEDVPASQLGHDIWLSRNGHGAGFFDRDFKYVNELQDEAERLGPVHLFIENELVEIE